MWMCIFQTELVEEWLHMLIEQWTSNIGGIDEGVIMRSSDGEYGLG